MPQGKGTYGSQVGRPPKKKYNKGGNVDPFSTRNPEGVPAEQLAEMMENQNMANEGLPTNNAQERSQVSPDVTEYKEGGKVKKDAPHLKSDNPKVQKMLDEGRKRYVKKQNVLDEYEKMRPKKSKGLAAPPKDKRPRPPKNSMKNQGKKKKKWEGQA